VASQPELPPPAGKKVFELWNCLDHEQFHPAAYLRLAGYLREEPMTTTVLLEGAGRSLRGCGAGAATCRGAGAELWLRPITIPVRCAGALRRRTLASARLVIGYLGPASSRPVCPTTVGSLARGSAATASAPTTMRGAGGGGAWGSAIEVAMVGVSTHRQLGEEGGSDLLGQGVGVHLVGDGRDQCAGLGRGGGRWGGAHRVPSRPPEASISYMEPEGGFGSILRNMARPCQCLKRRNRFQTFLRCRSRAI
jgi:hypothetical protein